jgi:hypothetical protein
MARTPVLVGTPVVEAYPGADDADQDEDHADEDDEVSGVLTQGEARDPQLGDVRDEVVLDEIEQQAEGHDRDPEAGKSREWRAARQRRTGGERRDRERIDQSAYLRGVSIANVDYC